MNNHILKCFGNKIRNLRTTKKLTQEELAALANLHRTYIGMIERGEKNITLTNIAKIAEALEVGMNDLFTFDQKD